MAQPPKSSVGADGNTPLSRLIERMGFNRFVLFVALFFAGATFSVNIIPLVYAQLSYQSNPDRLEPVLRSGNPELIDLAQRLVNQENTVLSRSDYDWMFQTRALYYLHRDEPESFAVSNEWLIGVARSNALSQADLLQLQALAESTEFLSTTQATNWLLSVLNKESVSTRQAVGLSVLKEKIISGEVKQFREGSEKNPGLTK